jgi:hypothetical protein
MMQHYIYKIKQKDSDNIYIGIHSTSNLNDGYMGSGVNLRRLMSELGKDSFEKEIISYHKTREEALEKEREIVNKDFVMQPNVLNIALGGGGVNICKEKRKQLVVINKKELRKYSKPFDVDHYYTLKLQNYTFLARKKYLAFDTAIANEIPNMLKLISNWYNDDKLNKDANAYIKKLMRYDFFQNNLFIEKRKRQLTIAL